MSDLISRGKLFNLLAPVQTLGEAYGIIQEMPTVDAVEVVRCRDCQYWERDHELDGYPLFEGHMVCKYAIGHSSVRYPHDFCSKGVRKDCNNEAD